MKIEMVRETEEFLLRWCNQRLQTGVSITAETDLLEEGHLDSLVIMDLVDAIEKQYSVCFDSADIAPKNFRNVRALGALVASRRAV